MGALSVELRTIAKGTRLSSLQVPVLEEAASRLEELERELNAARALLQEREREIAGWETWSRSSLSRLS
jgi:hypothetical protein